MADVVLKDRDGNPVTHEGVDTVRMVGTDGEAADFIPADEVPKAVEKVVNLDFKHAAGATYIAPEDGQVFSRVIISRPDGLLESNIREGVDIAGIIGTMASGAGGGLKAKWGAVSISSTASRISIDFGFKPDFLLLFACTDLNSTFLTYTGTKNLVHFGVSSALNALLYPAYNVYVNQYYAYRSSSKIYTSKVSYPIDHTGNAGICKCDETGFTNALSSTQGSYLYLAIGGLS